LYGYATRIVSCTCAWCRYIAAQLRNRREWARLVERHQTLDRQQRQATANIDRHRRQFIAELVYCNTAAAATTAGSYRPRANTAGDSDVISLNTICAGWFSPPSCGKKTLRNVCYSAVTCTLCR